MVDLAKPGAVGRGGGVFEIWVGSLRATHPQCETLYYISSSHHGNKYTTPNSVEMVDEGAEVNSTSIQIVHDLCHSSPQIH